MGFIEHSHGLRSCLVYFGSYLLRRSCAVLHVDLEVPVLKVFINAVIVEVIGLDTVNLEDVVPDSFPEILGVDLFDSKSARSH